MRSQEPGDYRCDYEGCKAEGEDMSEKLDAKFYGEIRKVKDGSLVPDDEYVVFLAKDTAFANMLMRYRAECVRLGADREQIDAVDRLDHRLRQWRAANPERLKVPDAAGEKLLDKIPK
jgi:hypothetical protein